MMHSLSMDVLALLRQRTRLNDRRCVCSVCGDEGGGSGRGGHASLTGQGEGGADHERGGVDAALHHDDRYVITVSVWFCGARLSSYEAIELE